MSSDLLEKLYFLTLGWLLGLLGPVIVDAIKRRRENALGRAAILSELKELASVLAGAAYGARMHLGTIDRSFLQWLQATLERLPLSESMASLLSNTRTQISWTDEMILSASTHMAGDISKATMLQRYPVPLLDARVAALWTFSTEFQRKLLEVRRNLFLLDELVARSNKYFDLSFSKLEGNNYNLVVANLNQTYELYAERAVIIVKLIRSISDEA